MRLFDTTKLLFTAALIALVSIALPAAAQNCEYEEWDSNNDTYLDSEEINTAFYDVDYYDEWDDDDNDTLSETEWEMGVDEHLGAYDSGQYTNWDTNGDDKISENEFHEGLFNLIDDDNDNRIGEDDWNVVSDGNQLYC